ncbi:hypothetical protein J2S53_000670 [Actinopolyspora lacussalsi]|nr:hypothetical protein [Actinopolyspora lacussalsi]
MSGVAGSSRALVLLFVVVLTTGIPGTAFAAPTQPPNPDRQRIREERAEVRHATDRVRALA